MRGIRYVELQDIVACALMRRIDRKNVNFVSFEELFAYAQNVSAKYGDDVVFKTGEEDFKKFIANYSKVFDFKDKGISLKEGLTTDDLIKDIVSNIHADILFELLQEKNLEPIIKSNPEVSTK